MVAGIGCRAGVSGEQVEAAIAAALAALRGGMAVGRLHGSAAEARGEPGTAARGSAAGRESDPSTLEAASRRDGLTAIATPVAKSHEPGIRAAAAARGLPLLLISQPDLEAANPATVTRSAHSLAAMNVHSVAEAAALAGAATLARTTMPAIHARGGLAALPTATSLAGAGAAPVPTGALLPDAGASATATAPGPANPTPRLLQARVAAGPVTCALADTTLP